MSNRQGSPGPRPARAGVFISAFAAFAASAAALLAQGCTETSAPKKPTTGGATNPDGAAIPSATAPAPPTNLPPPPT